MLARATGWRTSATSVAEMGERGCVAHQPTTDGARGCAGTPSTTRPRPAAVAAPASTTWRASATQWPRIERAMRDQSSCRNSGHSVATTTMSASIQAASAVGLGSHDGAGRGELGDTFGRGHRVVGCHARTTGHEALGQAKRRRFAQVIGAGLEGQPQHGHAQPTERLAGGHLQAVEQPVGLVLVGGCDGPHQLRLHAVPRSQLRQGASLRRETGATEAGTGRQEAAPDALVEAHAVDHRGDVGAGGRAEAGQLVGEGDLGGEEDVGSELDGLGAGQVGDHDGRFERGVQGAQVGDEGCAGIRRGHRQGACLGRVPDTEDHPVWLQEVGHRAGLTGELGIEGDLDVRVDGVGGGRRSPPRYRAASVLRMTMARGASGSPARASTAARTVPAVHSPSRSRVPTATMTRRVPWLAAGSAWNERRPPARPSATSSSRPGSRMGSCPSRRRATRSASTSSTRTSLPRCARQAAVTSPTYPAPSTLTCIGQAYPTTSAKAAFPAGVRRRGLGRRPWSSIPAVAAIRPWRQGWATGRSAASARNRRCDTSET